MTVDRRVTYRRSHSYNTRSNKIRKVKTPGGSVVVHYQTKKAKGVRCAATGVQLQGIPRLRPTEYKRLPKHDRTVRRAYGGVLSHKAVRDKIMRAFIVEEQRIVKKVLLEKVKASKSA